MPKFRNCPNLKEIHLGFNRIEELGDEDTENVAGLKLLDLKENKVIGKESLWNSSAQA